MKPEDKQPEEASENETKETSEEVSSNDLNEESKEEIKSEEAETGAEAPETQEAEAESSDGNDGSDDSGSSDGGDGGDSGSDSGDESNTEEAKIKLDYIRELTGTNQKKYFSLHKRYTKLAFVLRFLSLALSAIVTILLGLGLEPSKVYNGIALALSAVTGIVSGLAAFFDFSPLAVKYKDTADKFEALKLKADYLELGNKNIQMDDVSEFKDEYVEILQETSSFFQKVKSEELDGIEQDEPSGGNDEEKKSESDSDCPDK